jgi:diphthamide synthase (EF-2-diphthine--ammonia ligase)
LLPEGVDPCGENGEFHTFVYDDPIFSRRIDFELGERVLRGGKYLYVDLIPKREIHRPFPPRKIS